MFVARNGRWLSDPVVVLRAAKSTSALLQLANPVFDAAAKTVTFQVCADRRMFRSTCVLNHHLPLVSPCHTVIYSLLWYNACACAAWSK